MRRLIPLLCLPALSALAAHSPNDTTSSASMAIEPTVQVPYGVSGSPLTGITASTEPLAVTAGAGKPDKGDWVIAPIPGYDPSQGANIKAIAEYVFAPDKDASPDTPKDIIGLGAFYSEEHSRALGAAYSGSLDHDTWRLLALAGIGRLNYDFYGVGTGSAGRSIPVEQDMGFGLVRIMRRVHSHLFAGVRAQAMSIDSRARLTVPGGPSIPPFERQMTTAALGPTLQWDTRDNQFFPTRGDLVDFKADFFGEAVGSDIDYQVYDFDWNHYEPVAASGGVIAARARLRGTGGDVPFFGMGQFGQGCDLRGYIDGKYRDRMLAAFQVEYRQFFTRRWGFAAFGGTGSVAGKLDELLSEEQLWSAGGGLRFRMSEKNPISLRVDFAYGRDGPAWYVSVGEAF